MFGLGTLINVAAVIVGGIVGLLLGRRLKQRFADMLRSCIGLCVIFIGAAGVLEQILVIKDGRLTEVGSLMMVLSMCIGGLFGELIDIDTHTERFGNWLRAKCKSENDSGFTEGFVNASLTVCVGAMAIVGAIEDGLTGDCSILITKSILDFVIVMIMSTTHGKGCIFSALPILVLQGSFTLLARLIEPIMTTAALSNLSAVGSILIFCIGINLFFQKKIKVANFLPALVIAVLWSYLPI